MRFRRCALLTLVVGCLALPTACSRPAEPAATARLIVIGFDGLDPMLTEGWMEDGTLPNFRALHHAGHYQRLATSNPPQSPVAWSSFATGTGPGEHGIFDFLRRDPQTYHPDFSIASYTPPERHLSAFGWKLPLGAGEVRNRRIGSPFWLDADAAGQRATVLRVPVTYPADPVHRMLSGMGVPDLLGTQGTYTLYTTRSVANAESGGRVVLARMSESGRIDTRLDGPAHPLKPGAPALSLPLRIHVEPDGASIELDGTSRTIAVGEWSDWWPIRFDYGLGSIAAMVRLHLSEGFPRPLLYVSPIQVDPVEPVLALASPPDYAPQLAERIGRYHTLGMPEETWSLNQGHLDEEAFLSMVRSTLAEGEAMLHDTLDRNDSELIVKVFVQPDRVSHMFWRGLDPDHPLHAQSSALARTAIRDIYVEADRIVGDLRRRMTPADRLVILSDHGFSSFRRAVHLNRVLVELGYLVLAAGASQSSPLFAQVDWSRSRAYALGLNGVYVNQRGREGQGIVPVADKPALLDALVRDLAALAEADGTPMIRQMYRGAALYTGAQTVDAPDLVVGYAPGYRASWQTSLGGVPAAAVEDNLQRWSGDHCIDPEAVPGVLFASFALDPPMESITDVAALLRQHMPAPGTDPH